eukprot:138736-Prorocentrum_minimum.AAC.2
MTIGIHLPVVSNAQKNVNELPWGARMKGLGPSLCGVVGNNLNYKRLLRGCSFIARGAQGYYVGYQNISSCYFGAGTYSTGGGMGVGGVKSSAALAPTARTRDVSMKLVSVRRSPSKYVSVFTAVPLSGSMIVT